MSGHQYPEFWGRAHFWITFVGVNLTFFSHAFPRRFRACPADIQTIPRPLPDGTSSLRSADISGLGVLVFPVCGASHLYLKGAAGLELLGRRCDYARVASQLASPFHTFEELPAHVDNGPSAKHVLQMRGRPALWPWPRR